MAENLPIGLDKECLNHQESFDVSIIDKESLYKAVKQTYQDISVKFAFMQHNLVAVNSIQLNELGYIQVPVSLLVRLEFILHFCAIQNRTFDKLQDVQRLKKISQDAPYGKGKNTHLDPLIRKAMQIDKSKIISTAPVDLGLSSHVVRLLNLPADLMDVEVKLDELILYESGGHYQRTLYSKKESGT